MVDSEGTDNEEPTEKPVEESTEPTDKPAEESTDQLDEVELRRAARKRTRTVEMNVEELIPNIRKDFGAGYKYGSTVLFHVVPEGEPRNIEKAWRILLTPDHTTNVPFGLIIQDDAKLGRGDDVDLDLTPFITDKMSVSREHALLRPRPSALFLIDLGSRNGTFVNGFPVGPGIATRLNDDDSIALGNLHFTVNIIFAPATDED
jgi:hypothetical protein